MRPDFSKPVALFGGSFDPVHEGHIHLAREVRDGLRGTDLVFVPACRSPGKPEAKASGEQRLRWLQAVAGLEGFTVWDTELQRGGESFTVDTLKEAHRLGAAADRLFLVMGADAYQSLPRWRDPEEIRRLCRIVAVTRPGIPLERNETGDILLSIPPHPASSSAIRKALAESSSAAYLPAAVSDELHKLTLLNQNPYVRKEE